MFGFNFIFWLVGCALVGLGIWVLVDGNFKDLANRSDTFASLQYAGIALIVVGGIIMVVGFFGCCGAIRESQCLLVMFFICMLLLFLALVGAGVVCLIYKEEMITIVKDKFSGAVKDYDNDDPNDFVDLIQSTFTCCGVKGPGDYQVIPTTCPQAEDADLDTMKDALTGDLGCADKVEKTLEEYSVVAAGVALGAGVIMLLGMIFSMMLCCAIRDTD